MCVCMDTNGYICLYLVSTHISYRAADLEEEVGHHEAFGRGQGVAAVDVHAP